MTEEIIEPIIVPNLSKILEQKRKLKEQQNKEDNIKNGNQ